MPAAPALPSIERDTASTNRIEQLLTEREAARIMGFQPNTLAIWRVKKRVKIPYLVISGAIRYSPSAIEKFLAERVVGEDGITPKGVPRRPDGPGRPPRVRKGAREKKSRRGAR